MMKYFRRADVKEAVHATGRDFSGVVYLTISFCLYL
jgi:hypothetical protein